MKKTLILSCSLFLQIHLSAQCGAPVSGGSSSNMFTQIRNSTNPVVADKALNTVAFIHRINATAFGGNSGNLMYDVSTNAGVTWTSNIGFLNPVNSSFARYPNVTLYNPAANTTPANAYIGYLAATINTVSSAWNGVVTGVQQISGTGNTENYNQPIVNPALIGGSIVKGAAGIFWAIDALYNGINITGFTVYKGTWNSTTSDIVWSNNYNVSPPFNTGLVTAGTVGDYNIAFDPTGNIGYFSFLGHVTPGPANYAYYPVLYKTTNGGATWTGPIQVDLTQFSCATSNITTGNVPSTNFEHDLSVDANGNPHILTTLCNGTNAYSVYYTSWHHMFDITLKNGLWAAYDLGNVNAGRGAWGTVPNNASQDMAPQITRTADGNKIFFTWSDNSSYSLGASNLSPNMFSKAYDIVSDSWTQTKDFSSCNTSASGKILFPHVAPEVLEPSTGVFKLAPVYGEYSVSNDPLQLSNFYFLDNATFSSSEFTVPTPAANVSIQPGPSLLLCPTSSVTLSLGSAQGQFLWSTGSTNSSIAISSGTATSYSVVAQQGCYVGTASVTVSNMTLNANVINPNICPGSSATFTVAGNAPGYTWTPGNATGTNVILNPTTNTVILTAAGSGSCITTQTITINLLPQPTLNVVGTTTICAGVILSQIVSGAQTYLWDNGSTNSTFTDTPVTNTVYVVIGTAANTCTSMQTVSVTVKPSPTVNIISTQTTICIGQSVGLAANGAVTYSWGAVSSPPNITVTPASTTVYTVTGAATNLCENSKTVSVIVYALPSITITPTKLLFCKGEKTKLTASGAATYTWVSPGVLNSTVQVNPVTNTTYTVLGLSTDGCSNTQTFELVVSLCTGIGEQENNTAQLIIYPNPTHGTFVIKGSSANLTLNLVNELGQVVRSILLNEENQHETSVEELPAGIYFITNQQNSIKQKIVVAR